MAGAATAPDAPKANGTNQNGEKLTLAQRKKLKQKERKQAKKAERQEITNKLQQGSVATTTTKKQAKEDEVEIEYVSAPLEILLSEVAATAPHANEQEPADANANGDASDAPVAESLSEFRKIFEAFGSVEELLGGAPPPGWRSNNEEGAESLETGGPHKDDDDRNQAGGGGDGGDDDDGDNDNSSDDDDEDKLSKRKRKLANQMKIAELKQLCERPEVVEVWDVTATDPRLLVYLKAYRNTVPVPRHWSQKRKYLQGKRGIEKPAFKLPAFIEATGIGNMRQAYLEKAEQTKLKQKARERMTPKMGKLDIDYQVLYDAFFRHQTKPALSRHGELYYEGKEYEATTKHAKPGVISPALQEALGMTPGAPPPWLVAMQRFGPPPSYRSLRIAGLNAPIPPGAQFGYHPGGWGKPPVDEYGNPIYGDVFNQGLGDEEEEEMLHEQRAHWGDLESEEEESEEEEEESEEEEEEDEDGMPHPPHDMDALADGYTSVQSGFASSLPSGIETPAEVQLRKQGEAEAPKQLYQVLEQKQTTVGAGQLMGSDHTYVIPGGKKMSLAAQKRLEALRREMPSELDVSIDPTELESLDDAALKSLYERRLKEQRAESGREDFSDLVAAKAMQQTKRKATDKAGGGKDKKFKF